jgi:TonB family protein
MKTGLRIVLFSVLIVVTGLFNAGLIDIRVEELSYLLGRIASVDDISQTFGIVAKYELIKQRMEQGDDNIASYELEAKIQALTSGERYDEEEARWHASLYRLPVKLVVDGIRLLMGKEIINPRDDADVLKVLEIGYIWERNRNYREATKVYDEALQRTDLRSDVRAAVLVHKAFCHSMLSEYEISKKTYERVISEYPTTEAGILSWKLLDFIQTIESERNRVETSSASHFDKAKQYHLLMDYRNAIKFFSLFLQENPPLDRALEARYYKGRAHEELGEIEEAMTEYYTVMRLNENGAWAKQANRRLLMVGEFYDQKKQLAEEAKRRLDSYQDEGFMATLEQYTDMVSENSLRKELMAKVEKKKQSSSASTDSLLSFINSIGNLDLTGELEDEKRQEEMRRLQEKLIKKQGLTPAEIHEVTRRRMLEVNPYRRPSFIRKTITDYSSQLRYIYNRRLRKGVELSGTMVVRMEISPNGKIAKVNVLRSNVGDSEFENDVVDKIKGWRFHSSPDSLGALTVNYPLEFTKEE